MEQNITNNQYLVIIIINSVVCNKQSTLTLITSKAEMFFMFSAIYISSVICFCNHDTGQ